MLRIKNKVVFSALFLVSGCTIKPFISDSAPKFVPANIMAIANAVPRHEQRTRAGNPGRYKVLGKRYTVLPDSKNYKRRGVASWYGTKFHGRKTANGEIYDMYAMTAAHKTLPIPSYVRVTHLKNQRSVVVRINDRGPFHDNRLIDLSYTAAVKLGIQQTGTGLVEVTALEPAGQEKVAPSEAVKQTMDEKVYLQIGAFSNQFNAQQLQEKIALIQLENSRLNVAKDPDDALYKVQIGPLDPGDNVAEINTRLLEIGVKATKLVAESY